MNEDWVKIPRPYLVYFLRNKLSNNVTSQFGSCRFIVLVERTMVQLVLKWSYKFISIFLTVLELLECRRSDPYMIANRNLVRFRNSRIFVPYSGYFNSAIKDTKLLVNLNNEWYTIATWYTIRLEISQVFWWYYMLSFCICWEK